MDGERDVPDGLERPNPLDAVTAALGDLRAAKTRTMVTATPGRQSRLWPEFAATASAAGVAGYLAVPLSIDESFAGSLNLYSRQEGGFDAVDHTLVRLYVAAVEAAVYAARRYHQVRGLADHLTTALESRAVIDQAIGIVMATRHVDADQAFAVLAEQSQRHNVKVRVLADRLVAAAIDTRIDARLASGAAAGHHGRYDVERVAAAGPADDAGSPAGGGADPSRCPE